MRPRTGPAFSLDPTGCLSAALLLARILRLSLRRRHQGAGEPCTNEESRHEESKSIGLLCALALAATFAAETAAQGSHDSQAAASGNGKSVGAEGVTSNLPDMRLWSFGDCDNKFPFVNTDEHKECVRVVGSEEARDARAYRVCETSNARDPEEVARCKSTYKANKDRSAQSGYAPNSAPQAQAQPTAEDLQRVRAIAAAAVERDKALRRGALRPLPKPRAAYRIRRLRRPLPRNRDRRRSSLR